MPEPTIPADPQERARWLTERRELCTPLFPRVTEATRAYSDLPLLLDEIERLDGEIERLRDNSRVVINGAEKRW